MRVATLSMISAFRAPYRLAGIRGTQVRSLYSSAQMRSTRSPPLAPEWFQRVVDDGDAKPPRLFAWTPKDLSAGGETASTYNSSPHMRTRDYGDHERRRIYILGVGNIGRLYAICLSKLANRPPITLVVHRKELLERWAADPGIELTRHGELHRSADFDIEWWTDTAPEGANRVEVAGGGVISNLIIATKASDAVPQVDKLRRYLNSESTVSFTQNGMCKLWPPLGDAYVRARFPGGTSPNWVACVTTHGVTSLGPFKSIHAAPANVLVGPVMASGAGKKQMNDLIQDIVDAPDLNARQVPTKELWIAQLEKLVVNAIINPLTAVLRCQNGELLAIRDDALPVVIDKLLSEASQLLCALILHPESDQILRSGDVHEAEISRDAAAESLQASREQLIERFSFPQLRRMVLDVGAKVVKNTSSMLQDVRAGKQTEIDDINGWLLDTAKLVNKGRRLPAHEKLVMLVKARAELTRRELCTELLEDTTAED
ncbi:ketoisovalerate reductase [Xylaria intraflava]|nr:ketoisovalerate reductase [Xylaria intraflava]